MAFNNFRIALRLFRKQKTITLINLIGLSLGISSCLAIFFYINSEQTYNHSFLHSEKIARIVADIKTPDIVLPIATTHTPLADVLKKEYPEVNQVARLQPIDAVIKHNNTVFRQKEVFETDTSFFKVFSTEMLSGDPQRLLAEPNTAVMTKSTAEKYFGKENPINKTIKCNEIDFTVKGVIKDFPVNTDMKVSLLLSTNFSGSSDWWLENLPVYTYILFHEIPDITHQENKFIRIAEQYVNPAIQAQKVEGYSISFKLEMLKDMHYSPGRMDDFPKGNRHVIYLFSFLAIFVLAIALLNYINLLSAKLPERAKEVGIKKMSGASRIGLFKQFLGEAMMISGTAVVLSTLLIYLLIPLLNHHFDTGIRMEWTRNAVYVLLALLLIAIASGIYPACIMSGYNPVLVLKGQFSKFGDTLTMRKVFTTFQFVLTVGMIAGVIIIYRQMNYWQHFDIGFDKERTLTIHLPQNETVRNAASSLANEFRQLTNVSDVSLGSGLQPDQNEALIGTTFIRDEDGRKKEFMSNYVFIDERTIPLLKIRIADGRNISADSADMSGAFMVNDAFVKRIGLKNPIGRDMESFDRKGKIIAVVKNFNYQSLHTEIAPLVMMYKNKNTPTIMLKLQAGEIGQVNKIWSARFPDFPFEYTFLDEVYNNQYRKDKTVAVLFVFFAFLVVFISFLGLYALLSLNILQRTREIGVRKVLGASATSVFLLLYKDFLAILITAVLIATPLTWMGMSKWLQNFAYREDVHWWIFLVSGMITLLLSFFVLYFRIAKVTRENPVYALRVG